MTNKGLQRIVTDKFYTKPEIVMKCIDYIKEHLVINYTDVLIEPSAGAGAFYIKLKDCFTNNILAYDILPELDDIKKQDWLTLDITPFKDKKVHIIGNPPFGRQSSSAKKFINKCCKFAESISFILPKSFKKTSFQKSFSLSYHLIFSIDIEDNAFTIDNETHNVPTVFQIWIKKDIDRVIDIPEDSKYFTFVKKDQQPDLSIRRVGVNAGNCCKDINNKSISSHYFVKLNDTLDIDDFINKINNLNLNNEDNTVGPKSISKGELTKKTNQILFENNP